MSSIDKRTMIAPTVGLFTSVSTLLCCALPALLVSIGAGATLAGIVSNVPELIWLSQYKEYVFAIAGVMLVIAGVLTWNSRKLPCPADPLQAQACMRMRRFSSVVYVLSVVVYSIGFFFAFLAKHLLF